MALLISAFGLIKKKKKFNLLDSTSFFFVWVK